jgi:orotidine-5'-phosphate decarboxylase
MQFNTQIKKITKQNNSLLCVGLDSDLEKIPQHLKSNENALFEFNKHIIDQTHDLVCAYKIQIAFYSAYAKEEDIILTTAYIHKNYPDVPVILDAKRGDIGNTAECYGKEAFVRYKADALTVNPYMGFDSLEPLLNYKDKGVIILCRTSNPGAKDLQDLIADGQQLYKHVANKASKDWNKNKNIALVIGATYPKELAEIRAIAGDDIPFLVPGVGAQGGEVQAAVVNGMDSTGAGLMINSSRAIIYAGKDKDYAKTARAVAEKTRDEINLFRWPVIKG